MNVSDRIKQKIDSRKKEIHDKLGREFAKQKLILTEHKRKLSAKRVVTKKSVLSVGWLLASVDYTTDISSDQDTVAESMIEQTLRNLRAKNIVANSIGCIEGNKSLTL